MTPETGNRMKEEKIRWQKLMKTTDTYIWSHSSHRVTILFSLRLPQMRADFWGN